MRLCENAERRAIASTLLALVDDPSPLVRRQLAYTLGEWDDPRAGEALGEARDDDARRRRDAHRRPQLRRREHCGDDARRGRWRRRQRRGRDAWIPPLVATAAASDDRRAARARRSPPSLPAERRRTDRRAVRRAGRACSTRWTAKRRRAAGATATTHRRTLAAARRVAADDAAPTTPPAKPRCSCSARRRRRGGRARRCSATSPRAATSDALRAAALAALRRQQSPDVAERAARALAADVARRAGRRRQPAARPRRVDASRCSTRSKKRRVSRNEISLDRPPAPRREPERRRSARSPPRSSRRRPAGSARRDRRAVRVRRDAHRRRRRAAPSCSRKNCAACHALDGVGHDVGPDLAALRDKDADYFVKNILDPSAVVEPRFVNYQVVTEGPPRRSPASSSPRPRRASRSPAATASTETVARADVKDIRASTMSMMPEGFEAAFTPQQMADLDRVPQAARRRERSSPATRRRRSSRRSDGSLILPATKAEIFGGADRARERVPEHRLLARRAAITSRGRSSVDKAGEFDVHLDYACADESAGNTFVVDVGGGRRSPASSRRPGRTGRATSR